MRALWLSLVAGLMAVPPILLLGSDGRAAELLENGAFEQWSAEGPEGWFGAATATPGASGLGALLVADSTAALQQSVTVTPGARYSATVRARADSGNATVAVQLAFFDDTRMPLGTFESPEVLAGGAFGTYRVEAVAPEGSTYVAFAIVAMSMAGSASVVVDSASLSLAAAGTPTATPTQPAATPTPTPTAGAPVTATGTTPPTSTLTPTTTRTPATQTITPTTAATPKPTNPSATSTRTYTATPVGGGDEWDGGLLLNGGFEQVRNGQPVSWAKYGGTMHSHGEARSGNQSVMLDSNTNSSKWIHQVVAVRGGDWYEARADARLAYGRGEVFIRVSWYAAMDGSGSSIAQQDSAVSTGTGWTSLSTGAIQAPARARSARVRLMLRPDGAAGAAFDNARFNAVEEPAPSADLTSLRVPFLAMDSAAAGERRLVAPLMFTHPSSDQPRSALLQAAAGVRISEIASDPAEAGRDTDFEWVELVNTGTTPVDLAGWQLGEAKQLDALPSYELLPGAYVVVAAKSAALGADVPVIRVPDGDIGRGLNNSGDVVRLVAPDGGQADAVSYGDDASVTSPAPTVPGAGQTIGWDSERDTWRKTQRPTPGSANAFAQVPASGSTTPASGRGTASSTGGEPPREEPREFVEVVEGGEGDSPVPWILLGAAGGAGAVAGAVGGARAWARRRRR